jgi:hypothetical protein
MLCPKAIQSKGELGMNVAAERRMAARGDLAQIGASRRTRRSPPGMIYSEIKRSLLKTRPGNLILPAISLFC